MKKKIIGILVIAIIITLGLFGFWSKNYLTALWYFRSDNPERHRLAFSYLDEISGSITIDLFERLGGKLQKEVYQDYQSYKRAELIKRYNNTLIAYINDDFNICIRNFEGSKIKRLVLPEHSIYFDSKLFWAKDGKQLYVATEDNIKYFIDISNFEEKENRSDYEYSWADWAPDNTKLVLNHGPDVHVLNLNNLELKKIYSKDFSAARDSPFRYSAFYPIWLDDKNILVSIKNNLEIINSETRERKIIHTTEKANKLAMSSFTTLNFTFGMKALSYSGQLVAMEGGAVFNLEDKTVVYKGFHEYPTWSPDDKYIMSHHLGTHSSNPEGIQITPYDDEERFYNIKIYMGPGKAPAWSPPLDNYDEVIAQMDDNEIDYNFELEKLLFR